MPPRKDYGPPTRESPRFSQQNDETTAKTSLEPLEPSRTTAASSQQSLLPLNRNQFNPDSRMLSVETEDTERDPSPERFYDTTPETEDVYRLNIELSETPRGPTPNMEEQVRALMATLQSLQDRLDNPEVNNARRSVTPATSAFGGTDFRPAGQAAMKSFESYGNSQNSSNPNYNPSVRESRTDPGNFDGDKKDFDKWTIKLADKLRRDNKTYETE